MLSWSYRRAIGVFAILLWSSLASTEEKAGLDRLWIDLGKADAPTGQRAVWELADRPAESVPFLREKLSKINRQPDAARMNRLVSELDSDDFVRREKATKEFDKLGNQAVPALRTALEGKLSLEVVRRIERILEKHDRPAILLPEGDALRGVRAIQSLELIGTLEASKVLEELSKGPRTDLGLEARKALDRLERRSGGRR